MSNNLRIAYRFLTARKRSMLMSLSCTVLGVGLFVITQATTGGFKEFFIATILGTDGAIHVEDRIQDTARTLKQAVNLKDPSGGFGARYIEGIEAPEIALAAIRRVPNVSGASAVLKGNALIRRGAKKENAQVIGIDIDEHLKVSQLDRQIVEGDIGGFRSSSSGALVGRVLADRLALGIGDSFLLDFQGQPRAYKVRGIFETGIADIDKVRVYLHTDEARSLLKKPFGATFIQVNLRDPYLAPQDSEQMQETLGHVVTPWQVREIVWLSAFNALSTSSAITVSVFTLIAGLAMFNTLAMIVIEKTKDIAILRSMGYDRRDITNIFLWQAAIVLAAGAVFGSLLGVAGTYGVSQIPLPINGIFKTETYQVAWSGWHYFFGVLTATVMVMAASIIPARRAARLEPGDIVRGTAQ